SLGSSVWPDSSTLWPSIGSSLKLPAGGGAFFPPKPGEALQNKFAPFYAFWGWEGRRGGVVCFCLGFSVCPTVGVAAGCRTRGGGRRCGPTGGVGAGAGAGAGAAVASPVGAGGGERCPAGPCPLPPPTRSRSASAERPETTASATRSACCSYGSPAWPTPP